MAIGTPVLPRRPSPDAYEPDLTATADGLAAAAVEPTPTRGAKRLLWLAGAVLLAVLVAVIAIGHWRGAAQWQRFRDAAAVAQAESDAREPSRPVLWGELHEGQAWPHYERALLLLTRPADNSYIGYLAYLGRVEGRRLAGLPNTESPRTGPSAAETIAAHAAAIAALSAGTHSTDARRSMDWSAGFNIPVQNLLTARQLANAAKLTAMLASEDGDGERAVQLLLDAMQLGRDLAQSPLLIEQMIGCAVLLIGTREALTETNLLRHLDAGALRTFADGLARLDAALPLESRWIATEAALLSHLRGDPAGAVEVWFDATTPLPAATRVRMAWDAWRYGFCTRLAVARHGLDQLQLAARVQALSAEHDSLDVAAIGRLFAEATASTNPVTKLLTPNLWSGLTNRLSTVASVRLLRMAVQHALGEGVVPLPDPSGGMLRWAVDAQGDAEFWCDHDRKVARLRVPK